MDIKLYDSIHRDMVTYNSRITQNYGNVVKQTPPTKPTYPLTVIEEIRNVVNPRYNSRFDRVASVGYRIEIYAKSKGNITGQTIARSLAKEFDNYMTNYVGLTQTSWNVTSLENDGSTYTIVMVYTGNFHENRIKIL